MAQLNEAVIAELRRRGVELPPKQEPKHGEHLLAIAKAVETASARSAAQAEATIQALKATNAAMLKALEAQTKAIARIADILNKPEKPDDKEEIAEARKQTGILSDIAESIAIIAAEESKPETKKAEKKLELDFKLDKNGDVIGIREK